MIILFYCLMFPARNTSVDSSRRDPEPVSSHPKTVCFKLSLGLYQWSSSKDKVWMVIILVDAKLAFFLNTDTYFESLREQKNVTEKCH